MTLLVACRACHRQYDVGTMKPGEQVRCACGRTIVVPGEQAHVARVAHCSSCGGDVGLGAKECHYCGSELAPAAFGPACPLCFARLAAGARYCSECGVGINPEQIRTTPVDVACPRCQGKLVVRELENMLLTDCTSCGGLWLDAQAFEKLVQQKDTKRLSTAALSPVARPPRAPETVKYIPCLVCKKLMERKNFAGCSGVIIDWCRGHGIWFDAHELEQVVKFIEQGGLEKAHQRELAARPVPRPTARPPVAPLDVTSYPGPVSPAPGDWAGFILWTLADIFF